MRTTNSFISKLCTGLFATALAFVCIPSAHAERVKVKNVATCRVPTANVDVADDECTLFVNLPLWRVNECSVICVDEETGLESLNMDVPLVNHKLEVQLDALPLGTYEVSISNGTATLIVLLEKIDETSSFYYDPFAVTKTGVR